MAYFWTEPSAMKKTALLWMMILGTGVCAYAQSEIFSPMRDAIRANDAGGLVKSFAQSVDINLEGSINTYSRAQSEFVLKEFFRKHPVNDFSIVHVGSSKGGLQFCIGKYVSGSDSYNVLMRVRQVGSENLVHEISFVKE